MQNSGKMSNSDLSQLMLAMEPAWRSRWCDGNGACSCMGAANCTGGLVKAGVSKTEWEQWVEQNPDLLSKPSTKGVCFLTAEDIDQLLKSVE